MSARRFLWRWNLRVLRREWRQHLVIFLLIWLGVALAVGGALAAYNLVEPPESEFGNGQFSATTSMPDQLEAALVAQGQPFARIDSITQQVSGSTERVETRAFDPQNEVAAPLISLLDGRWPSAPGEVALTDRALRTSPVMGAQVSFGGTVVTVVGEVENPTDLGDQFALARDLSAFDTDASAVAVQFFIDANEAELDLSGVSDFGASTVDGPPVRTAAAIAVNVVGAVGMLEVALLVGAAFAVIAKRRSRQFGLLAAAGATPRLVRSAATLSGTILGLVGALLGVIVGVGVAAVLVPTMESAVGHRIAFEAPWWAIAPNAIVAVVVASLAARWPTRALSKKPVVHMLSALRPRPEPVGRASVVGVVLTVAGALALAVGFARLNEMLALLGTVLAPVGLLLMAPLLVRVVGRFASRLPLAPRLAGRAIARQNRRSASVVAALALALAIPIGIAVVTTSLDQRSADNGPNLADNWMIAWVPGADDPSPRIPADIDAQAASDTQARLAAAAPEIEFIPLEVAIVQGSQPGPWEFESIGQALSFDPLVAAQRSAAECVFCDIDSYGFGETDEAGKEISYLVGSAWIATPKLLEALSIETSWLATPAKAIAKSDGYEVAGLEGIVATKDLVSVSSQWPRNTGIPSLLYSPTLVESERYEIVRVGWLGRSDGPVSAENQAELFEIAAEDLLLELPKAPEPKSGLRAAGVAIGLVVGLGVALSAVGLLSAELSDDLRLLSSIGASPRAARRLAASVAVILALTGAIIAVLIGYLPILPMLTAKGDNFPFVVPWPALVCFLILFPAVCAAAGWFSSRTPALGDSLRESI